MRSDPFLLFHAVQRHTAARCEILRGRGFIQRERVGAGLPEVRSVRRADRKPRICMLRTVAGDEHAARLSLVRDYVLSFAGRLPVAEVRA